MNVLMRVGFKKAFVKSSVPIIPISGWVGDNLITHSDKMPWYKGFDTTIDTGAMKGKTVHVHTLLDALDKMVQLPTRDPSAAMRMPVSGVYKIKGVGDVITGRIEQGVVTPGDETVFLPTHTSSKACTGKVFTVEMHHKNQPQAFAGDNVGLNVKGLNKENMPRVGDVMIKKDDTTLSRVANFNATVQVLDHPGELKAGYTPIGFVRTGRSAIKMAKINWKMGKSTGNQKAEDPVMVKANEMASINFEPQQPFVCDGFKKCEGLGRIAIMEGNGVVMLGKIMKTEKFVEIKKK